MLTQAVKVDDGRRNDDDTERDQNESCRPRHGEHHPRTQLGRLRLSGTAVEWISSLSVEMVIGKQVGYADYRNAERHEHDAGTDEYVVRVTATLARLRLRP